MCSESSWLRLPATLGSAPEANIGLIALANDSGVESDFRAYLDASEAMIATTRVSSPKVSSVASLIDIQHRLGAAAIQVMPDSDLDVIAFACTSATIAAGPNVVRDSILAARPGVAVVDPITAALDGLKKMRCSRIALITPYVSEVNQIVATYIEREGVTIVRRANLPLTNDAERSRVTGDGLSYAVDKAVEGVSVDAVFIACTALQTAHHLERLEAQIALPVVTSNQALAWNALRLAGVGQSIKGRGRLFE